MAESGDNQSNVIPQGRGGICAWLELLRLPNLFTVPGDPLVGCLLAGAGFGTAGDEWRIAAACLASLLLYACGLIQNDCFDLREDRIQRPRRPLPSGRVGVRAAIIAAAVLAVGGVAAAWVASAASGTMVVTLLAIMTVYNAGAKHVPLLGPVLMGVCRGLSLLLGAGLVGWESIIFPAVLFSAVGLTAFIAAVTIIASRETQTVAPGWRRWAPALLVGLWLGALLTVLSPRWSPTWAAMAMAVLAVSWMIYCGGLLKGRPQPAVVQRTVGLMLSGLLFVQAALAANASLDGLFVAMALLVAWPLSRLAAKRFYAS